MRRFMIRSVMERELLVDCSNGRGMRCMLPLHFDCGPALTFWPYIMPQACMPLLVMPRAPWRGALARSFFINKKQIAIPTTRESSSQIDISLLERSQHHSSSPSLQASCRSSSDPMHDAVGPRSSVIASVACPPARARSVCDDT